MVDNRITFSVIIFSSNSLSNLKNTIDSLKNQYYSTNEFEVLLCDSAIYTGIKKLSEKTKYINIEYCKLSKSASFSENIEKISAQTKGQYLVFIDDTGELSPDFLVEHENAHIKTDKQRAIIAGQIQFAPIFQRQPLVKYFNKKNANFAYPNILPYSFNDYRYFRLNNICLTKKSIIDAIELSKIYAHKQIDNENE